MKVKSFPHNFIVLSLAFVIAKCASLSGKKKEKLLKGKGM